MGTIALLNPKGLIALHERDLIIAVLLLMLVIVIPVFIFTFVIARKYRAGNANAKYTPDSHNKSIEILWWIFPSLIILALSFITWQSTFKLDPSRAIVSDKAPITVQVVALPWKWLFIYPQLNIATVNFLEIPVDTPVHFELSADNTPMNSFWIPELGGQIYAMTGMSTKLNLIANEQGDFAGSAAEINGDGFAGMRFTVHSGSEADFKKWVSSVRQSQNWLNRASYDALIKPSQNVPPSYYSEVEKNLYDAIIMKYMMPQ